MRKKWLLVAVAWVVLGAAVFGWLARATYRPAAELAHAAEGAGGGNLRAADEDVVAFTGFDFLLRPPYKSVADALVKFLSR